MSARFLQSSRSTLSYLLTLSLNKNIVRITTVDDSVMLESTVDTWVSEEEEKEEEEEEEEEEKEEEEEATMQ